MCDGKIDVDATYRAFLIALGEDPNDREFFELWRTHHHIIHGDEWIGPALGPSPLYTLQDIQNRMNNLLMEQERLSKQTRSWFLTEYLERQQAL